MPQLNSAFRDSMFLMTTAGICWVLVFHKMKLDGFYGGYEVSAVLSQLFTGLAALVMLIASAGFLLREQPSRLVLLNFCAMFFALAFGGRMLARSMARRLSGAGKRHRVLVMGKGRIAQEIAERIQKHPEMRWEIVGFLFPAGDDFVEPILHAAPTSQLNSLQIESLLTKERVDELILTTPVQEHGEMLNLVANCRQNGIKVSVVPSLYQLYVQRPSLIDLDGLPLIRMAEAQPVLLQSVVKRTIDVFGAGFLLILALPVLILSSVMLWMQKGSAFMAEVRCGLNGKRFRMLRFNVKRGSVSDLSRTEKMLRLLSFTELPQLLNVLKGDMSLVGPRPEAQERVKRYSDWQRQRLCCKPGLTGLAQVHGLREENSSEDKAYYDLRYLQDRSPLGDLSLILQTAWTISKRVLAEAPSGFELSAPETAEQTPEFAELAHADRS
jgi:lipopolysaccharide/colanic/teichoic acid biosynthesis glycosyltransferase